MTQLDKYRFLWDAGHAWLEVPRAEVAASSATISSYSYYNPKTDMVYLEEDCDMLSFLKAVGKDHTWRKYVSTTIHSSKPRRLPSYREVM